ncbi:MAG: succinylglutamate desuccinylase/aspartoacylase family protein [Pseudomonadota bacterium]
MQNPTGQRPAAVVKERRDPFEIGGVTIPAGTRRTVDLPLSLLSNHTPMTVPVHVVHGRKEGPRLFVCSALHGDEINGVEIIRRLLQLQRLSRLKGTLLAVPVVNVYGFVSNTRYLPDRRDLNRSFPGSANGSLAGQLANLFLQEVVSRSTHGIDLHTGAIHRTNFPQVRADLTNPEVLRLAYAFGAPLVLDAVLREGSLRQSAIKQNVPTLTYEAGEALRFDESGIRVGLRGVLHVMGALGMLSTPEISTKKPEKKKKMASVLARASYWVRAPSGGILRTSHLPGERINANAKLGSIFDPFGEKEIVVTANNPGILIGRTNLPVVNQGDALFHIASVVDVAVAEKSIEQFREEVEEKTELEDLDIV